MKKGSVFAFTAGGFIVGGILSLFLFAHFFLPAASGYYLTDPLYIKLDGRAEPYTYSSITDRSYVGNLYLKHPLFFYKREEGLRILSDLAARGYTPAGSNLFHFAIDDKPGHPPNKSDVLSAYKWARMTAEQGDLMDLVALLKFHNLADYKDVTSDIALVEKFALRTSLHGYAAYLAEYYTEQNNPKKKEYWAKKAEEIKKGSLTEPACATIMPWRGY